MWFRGVSSTSLRVCKQGLRQYRILALESSCDDACVALLEKPSADQSLQLIDEAKSTLNSKEVGGIIPTAAHEFHQAVLGDLVSAFCSKHSISAATPPDLLCVTQGPGMVGSLSASLQLAKGLAVAWNRPLIGVHHMLGHLLSPQLAESELKFPFLSLLCSGGHTMLVLLTSLTDHEVIINTTDIAAGDSIDKCARLLGLKGDMLGPQLERLVENIAVDTKTKFASKEWRRDSQLRYPKPMRSSKHKKIPDVLEFSFAPFLSTLQAHNVDDASRSYAAYALQEAIFDHIVDRIGVAFAKHGSKLSYEFGDGKFEGVSDFVCSGGVAANHVLRQKLSEKFGQDLTFHFPPLKLCTDNAAMIGNAGVEIFEKLRLKSRLSIVPVRKWPFDEMLDLGNWENVTPEEYARVTGYEDK